MRSSAIDLGLRLTDIEDFERDGKPLQAEPVHVMIKRKKRRGRGRRR